jgi:hypothetical protein
MFQFGGFRHKGKGDKPGKPAGLVLEFPQLPQMIDSLLDRFDMTEQHRAGAAPPHLVPNPMNLFPFFGSLLAAANFVTDQGIKNLGATPGQGIEAGAAQYMKRRFQGKFKDALGKMSHFDSGKRLDVHARVKFAKPSKQFEIPFARQRRMKATHHVNLCDSISKCAPRRVDDIRNRHFERMGITLSGAKGAKLAGQNANVRIVNVTIEYIGSTIPIFPFTDDIRNQTERIDISGPVELSCFLIVYPFGCDNLIVNWAKSRWDEARACEIFHKINLTQDDSPIKLPAIRLTSGATLGVGMCCKGYDEFCPRSGKSLNDRSGIDRA